MVVLKSYKKGNFVLRLMQDNNNFLNVALVEEIPNRQSFVKKVSRDYGNDEYHKAHRLFNSWKRKLINE